MRDQPRVNGRQKHAIENLAAALNECFDAAMEKSAHAAGEAKYAAEEAKQAAEEAKQAAEEAKCAAEEARYAAEEARHAAEDAKQVVVGLGVRMDRQDATLRMIWTQCGGKKEQRLPIDG